MKNFLFYLFTVLIWGSTWIAIKMQLGRVDPIVSVAWRFSLAAILLLGWCGIRRLHMRFTLREHGFILLQGILLFGFNYQLFYVSEEYLTSGLAAVIFSTVLIMNIINGAVFLHSRIDGRVVIGGVLGLTGITLVFLPEITSFSLQDGSLRGIAAALTATLLASFGNIISARNQKAGLPIVQTNAYGMAYGALTMYAVILLSGRPMSFDFSVTYTASLVYLAVFGSIVAFGCYLSLVGNIGVDRAAYSTLLFPLVALFISTIWEDYHWTGASVSGVLLILLGNLWILNKGVLYRRSINSSATFFPERSIPPKTGPIR